ncbi:MarR family winged helix-turn-helix transcriptional regulator [Oceanibaculum nanhaiense]|jgi:DNA-binding MarR family transcriptional regulator|uniref:MarR family winged helix-turn-helix transcriptional regulator n=2 Tax=Oceanibaculum nanhaiense TaxID=1909734 RepID=UPI000A3983A4|nr:MarR family transcriptional regulator [Oceanibaculum nanhaiense]MBC7136487.1 MarR family transcriptional regulator [Oceanibaculum nanhaiense]
MKARQIPDSPGQPDESPGFLLWQLANAWQRQMRIVLSPLGLTYVQAMLLTALLRLEEREAITGTPITQGDLARFCQADATMTSQVLRTLEAKGLLERSRGADARARLPRLTAAGRALAERALPLAEAVDREFFDLPRQSRKPISNDSELMVDLRMLWARQRDNGELAS